MGGSPGKRGMIARIAWWLGILLLPAAPCGADTCTTCHALIGSRGGWEHSFSDWEESLHAQVEVDCVSCHGGDGSSPSPEEAHAGMTPVGGGDTAESRLLAARVCGSCHVEKYRAFARSRHYQRLVEGEMAAYCHTCHTSVGSRVLTEETIATTCRRCHPDSGGGGVAARARRVLTCLTRMRLAITFRAPSAHLTTAQWERLHRSATVAMAKWHAFDLDAVEEALSRGRPLLHAADGGP